MNDSMAEEMKASAPSVQFGQDAKLLVGSSIADT